MKTSGALATLAVLAASASVATGEERLSSPRIELDRVAAVLDVAVRKAAAPAAVAVVGAPTVRGYRLAGFGVLFVVPPRALPGHTRRMIVLRPNGPDGAASEEAPAKNRHVADAARARVEAAQPQPLDPRSLEREIATLELEVSSYSREAEQTRREAERAFEQMARELRDQLATLPAPPPVPAVAAAAPAPAPEAPLPPAPPPWRFWFQTDDAEEARPADRVIADVRVAVTQALENQGPQLRSVRPDEFVAVAVDFAPRVFLTWQAAQGERAGKTLVIRVRKRDLDDRQVGRLSGDDLRKRIEVTEY